MGKKEFRDTLQYICERFRIPGQVVEYNQITSGNINTTYRIVCDDNGERKEYLVQRVNCYVFRDPISMMRNIDLITAHIMKKNEEHGISERRSRLHFHHTDAGTNYLFFDNEEGKEFWRLSNFIEDSITFDQSNDLKVMKMTGKAFGRFAAQLSDFDASQLVETIPHFHDTRLRLEGFFRNVEADSCGRCAEAAEEIAFIREQTAMACRLNEMLDRGELSFRVTHNDTKCNNVMFDRETLEPLIVVDLDTCMPGLMAFDFGDAVRFAANTAAEDEPDLSLVSLDLEQFRAFAEGYITETAGILSETELSSMVLGTVTITLELAMRFLDDYITGDKYFRIAYPKHNLVRTRSQLTLLRDMLKKYDKMEAIVREVAERVREK